MPRLDINLLRKRSEHNEGEIGTLEELSLHQEDLEKLEHLQNLCKDLKILLLHSNLIAKIENIGKLKKLEYINFSLNNIERIENLEGCESLKKLDFTLNFIGELTSVANLKGNIFLESLYLIGNPCSEFEGYREYVAAVLPQLKQLDGKDIYISDRITALQNFDKLKYEILAQEKEYKAIREIQRKKFTPQFNEDEEITEENTKSYWSQMSDNTPEVRKELAFVTRKLKKKEKQSQMESDPRIVKLFKKDGTPLCINQAKIPFEFVVDDEEMYVLDIAVYKYMDTNLLDVDVQPKYVKVLIKDKLFQITFAEEVCPDQCKAQRSQTTGHLMITMPKLLGILCPKKKETSEALSKEEEKKRQTTDNFLDVYEQSDEMDFSKIISESNKSKKNLSDINLSEIPDLE